jgi:hypothetical protein
MNEPPSEGSQRPFGGNLDNDLGATSGAQIPPRGVSTPGARLIQQFGLLPHGSHNF